MISSEKLEEIAKDCEGDMIHVVNGLNFCGVSILEKCPIFCEYHGNKEFLYLEEPDECLTIKNLPYKLKMVYRCEYET